MQLINYLVLAVFAVAGVYAQQPQINTPPSVVVCQPSQLTFSGGTPPYFISILPGGQVGAAALESLGQQSGSSLTWKADIAAGTSITFQIRDSNGVTAFSAPVSIQAGSDNSCVGQNSASSGSSSAASTGSSSSASSSASGSTSVSASSSASSASVSSSSSASSSAASSASGSSASSTKPATSGGASATTSGSPAATTSPNAAIRFDSGPAAGIIGLLLAALFV